ncbi:hypothetical protein NRB56_12050 [Nocardia sp. RB56]|uniref:Uncharacterized protein n=2 Tax=Nocardia aurantia TaxID=2585199 RepID=A0A7K0DJ21_9NOCA|nr:hypothetical protein [Nocardia aurantia]
MRRHHSPATGFAVRAPGGSDPDAGRRRAVPWPVWVIVAALAVTVAVAIFLPWTEPTERVRRIVTRLHRANAFGHGSLATLSGTWPIAVLVAAGLTVLLAVTAVVVRGRWVAGSGGATAIATGVLAVLLGLRARHRIAEANAHNPLHLPFRLVDPGIGTVVAPTAGTLLALAGLGVLIRALTARR